MNAAEAYGLLVKNQTESLPLKNILVSSFVQGYLLGRRLQSRSGQSSARERGRDPPDHGG